MKIKRAAEERLPSCVSASRHQVASRWACRGTAWRARLSACESRLWPLRRAEPTPGRCSGSCTRGPSASAACPRTGPGTACCCCREPLPSTPPACSGRSISRQRCRPPHFRLLFQQPTTCWAAAGQGSSRSTLISVGLCSTSLPRVTWAFVRS